jgi:hypothetical protein
VALLGKRHARGPVCGELLIFDTNQQFATDRLAAAFTAGNAINFPVSAIEVKAR